MDKQRSEREYIVGTLLPEFQEKFLAWNKEYGHLERDLGMRGTFTDFWRKAKKIRAVVWEGTSDAGWREGIRIVLFEVIGNAFLLLHDLDNTDPFATPEGEDPMPPQADCRYTKGHDPHLWGAESGDFWCGGIDA